MHESPGSGGAGPAAAQYWTSQHLPVATGAVVPELTSIDDTVERFLAENQLPGASIAIARSGTLLYARGGWELAPVASNRPAEAFKYGHLAGSNSGLLLRRSDQLAVAILFNSDLCPDAQQPAIKIHPLLTHALTPSPAGPSLPAPRTPPPADAHAMNAERPGTPQAPAPPPRPRPRTSS